MLRYVVIPGGSLLQIREMLLAPFSRHRSVNEIDDLDEESGRGVGKAIGKAKLGLQQFVNTARISTDVGESKRSPYAYLRESGVSARRERPIRAEVTGSSISKISSFTNSSRFVLITKKRLSGCRSLQSRMAEMASTMF
jgi:hypothetical protein